MLLTVMSHKLRILLCCSPKSFLQPAGAWVYFRFKCEWDTICFLHLRLNGIFVPSLRCRQERCAHLCLVSAVHCLHESPFRNPCQTSEGITVMFCPIRFTGLPKYLPLWGSSSSHNTTVVGKPSELHLSHVAGTGPTTEMNELMGGLRGIKKEGGDEGGWERIWQGFLSSFWCI